MVWLPLSRHLLQKDVGMDFVFTQDEERFRLELGEFLDSELTDEICRQNWEDKGLGPEGREFARKLAAGGWLSQSWPVEYGGQGRSTIYYYILFTELAKRGAHIPNEVAFGTVGHTLLAHGSEALKQEFLPRIMRGEIEFCLGYTESEAGSDIAALEIRAVEAGDDYIINGHKIFNTEAHYSEYHWLAARTDPNVPKHRGISLFIVDLASPGISINPMWTMSGERTNEVVYDDVRVPKRMMVGEKNRGFYYMMDAFAFERIFVFATEFLCPYFDSMVEHVKQSRHHGEPLSKDPLIRQKLAEMAIQLEVGSLIEAQAFWLISKNLPSEVETSISKIFSSELAQRLLNSAMQILGQYGQLQEGSLLAPFNGSIERNYRASPMPTFAGGTNEVLRNVIAMRGLELPNK
jgi:alkylation response protein AidB-like acyl-CoA dehydrogenase